MRARLGPVPRWPPGRHGGFTLIEVMVASAISVIVIAATTAMLVNALKSWQAESVRTELHMDLEKSMEHLRKDLRLSSVGIGLMAFYPPSASEYTAISFPLATNLVGGMLPRDTNDRIAWDTTVIYHVRPGTPDQLLRTTFAPRKSGATPAELSAQLVAVVAAANDAGVQAAALAGEVASSKVLFDNLVNLRIRPPDLSFDGYADTPQKADTLNWGAAILGNGNHSLTFKVEGKNGSSTGYKIGIDRFAMSASASPREGELFSPVNTHPVAPLFDYSVTAGGVSVDDMSGYGADWSGNAQLTANLPAVGDSITFIVGNDLWCDANFDNPPGVGSNCSRKTDYTFTNTAPFVPDVVIAPDTGSAWKADNIATSVAPITVTNQNVVTVLHGSTTDTSVINLEGGWVRARFAAGANNLYVRDAHIAKQLATTNEVAGTKANFLFAGSVATTVPAGGSTWSDWVQYDLMRDVAYLVAWRRKDAGGGDPPGATGAAAWEWDGVTPSPVGYLDGLPSDLVVGLAELEVRFADRSIYTSGIFDTKIDNPTYLQLNWTHVEPFVGGDGDIDVRVRSGDQPDLSDACAWYPVAYFQSNVGNDIGMISGGRYVQYEVLFTSVNNNTAEAKLRDLTITWTTENGIVDLLVDFARGPDYGIVTAEVDGLTFIRGIEFELEIFKDGPFGREQAAGIMEVRPLNTER